MPFYKGLQHPWILVSAGTPGTNTLQIPRDNCNCNFSKFKMIDFWKILYFLLGMFNVYSSDED